MAWSRNHQDDSTAAADSNTTTITTATTYSLTVQLFVALNST